VGNARMGRLLGLAAVAGLLVMALSGPAAAQDKPGAKGKQPQFMPSVLCRVFTAYPTPAGSCKLAARQVENKARQGALLVGVVDRVEARFTRIDPKRGSSVSTLGLKLQLVKPDRQTPAVTLGIEDIFEDTKVGRAYYLVASHAIPEANFRVHGGLWTDDLKTGPLLGAEVILELSKHNPRQKAILLADYNRDSVNAGVRLCFPKLSGLIEVGVFDVGGDNDFVVGIRRRIPGR